MCLVSYPGFEENRKTNFEQKLSSPDPTVHVRCARHTAVYIGRG